MPLHDRFTQIKQMTGDGILRVVCHVARLKFLQVITLEFRPDLKQRHLARAVFCNKMNGTKKTKQMIAP